eukprot:TRINITY_DN782015_c0_g1_i1.p1 TRINITY_DN782015_c0_g1~~TRINITY_DN782015_c0_g1_i1.p1  ORF type:complete len:439 (+),score=84.84 TRINITY_DN782015_c0_g1_i1:80-1396(+)
MSLLKDSYHRYLIFFGSPVDESFFIEGILYHDIEISELYSLDIVGFSIDQFKNYANWKHSSLERLKNGIERNLMEKLVTGLMRRDLSLEIITGNGFVNEFTVECANSAYHSFKLGPQYFVGKSRGELDFGVMSIQFVYFIAKMIRNAVNAFLKREEFDSVDKSMFQSARLFQKNSKAYHESLTIESQELVKSVPKIWFDDSIIDKNSYERVAGCYMKNKISIQVNNHLHSVKPLVFRAECSLCHELMKTYGCMQCGFVLCAECVEFNKKDDIRIVDGASVKSIILKPGGGEIHDYNDDENEETLIQRESINIENISQLINNPIEIEKEHDDDDKDKDEMSEIQHKKEDIDETREPALPGYKPSNIKWKTEWPCTVCRLYCTSSGQFEDHLRGRSHFHRSEKILKQLKSNGKPVSKDILDLLRNIEKSRKQELLEKYCK